MKQINVYYLSMHENNVKLATLDLNLITGLSALLDQRSVTGAAEAVGRTQSAMSHSLSRLRDHFRDPILVRDGWEMRLTPFAEDLHPRVTAAAEAAKLMFATSFEFDPATTSRRIRIAAPDLCSSLFTGLIGEIAKRAPLASVEFISSSIARETVLRSEADIGLGFGRAKSDANLTLYPVAPLDWCTFAPKKHSFCLKRSMDAWSSSRHILVGQGGAQEGPVEKALRKLGIKRHAVGYASNFSAALILASETDALFTTLRAPFEKTAVRLGMLAVPLPFKMPNAPATLMFRADYGDPFVIWLKELCAKALS
ncbi:LysR family transcriptional regulator [uncultured Roseobacter sp.]|uniref:LysR family transcriptional regulator n=1 Tax=uncultured Roseobacter sp. TaxID=114847 RepID=UPI002603FDF1|nr:LysR family transcriptional regulator [uncultured Roseobacter sp.]